MCAIISCVYFEYEKTNEPDLDQRQMPFGNKELFLPLAQLSFGVDTHKGICHIKNVPAPIELLKSFPATTHENHNTYAGELILFWPLLSLWQSFKSSLGLVVGCKAAGLTDRDKDGETDWKIQKF